MRNERGVTLLEMTVSMGLMGVVSLAAAQILATSNGENYRAFARQSSANDMQLLAKGLQETMGTGSIRFFGFTGEPAGGSSPHPLSRLLIPQPGLCRNLGTTATMPGFADRFEPRFAPIVEFAFAPALALAFGPAPPPPPPVGQVSCAQQAAMLYVHYDKGLQAQVPAFCVVPDPGVNMGYVALVDGRDTSLGTLSFDLNQPGNGFTETGLTNGTVAINDGSVLAFFDPPKASLWVARGTPAVYNMTQDCNANVFEPDGTALPGQCSALLTTTTATCNGNSVTQKQIDQIYKIPVKPLALSQFTGMPSVSQADVDTAVSSVPFRVFGVDLKSLGAMPYTYATTQHPMQWSVGYGPCSVSSSTGVISCGGNPDIAVAPAYQARIDESFSTPLFDSLGNAMTATRYQPLLLFSGETLLGSSPPGGCDGTGCVALTIGSDTAIPALQNPAETLDNLDGTGFSLIKQEDLSILRLRVLLQQAVAGKSTVGNPDNNEEAIDVQFP